MVVTLLCFDLSNHKCFKVDQLPDAAKQFEQIIYCNGRSTNYFTQKVQSTVHAASTDCQRQWPSEIKRSYDDRSTSKIHLNRLSYDKQTQKRKKAIHYLS